MAVLAVEVPVCRRTCRWAQRGHAGWRMLLGCLVGPTLGRDQTYPQGSVRIKSKFIFCCVPCLLILTVKAFSR